MQDGRGGRSDPRGSPWGSPGRALALLGCVLGCSAPTPRGLEPPVGPVAPDARVIEVLPFRIERAGRYVLAGDLDGVPGEPGIVVACDRVEIDLGGFELRGGEATRSGILVEGTVRDLHVHGGTISWWGHDGVHAPGVRGARFEGLEIVNGGGHGLLAGEDCRVAHCRASYNWFGRGIQVGAHGRVESCTVSHNGHGGLRVGRRAWVRGLRAVRNTYGPGVVLGDDGLIENSVLWRNDREGLLGAERVRATGVLAEGNLGGGLVLGSDGTIEDSVSLADRDGPGFSFGARGHLRGAIASDNSAGPVRAGADFVLEGLRVAESVDEERVEDSIGPGSTVAELDARDLDPEEALEVFERLERPDAGRPTLDGTAWDWRPLLDPENPGGLAPPWARRLIPLDPNEGPELDSN